MGDIPVYTQTIYLNKLFLHKQMGLQVFFESKEEFFKHFNTESLIEVVSHELAHAILTNTNPKSQEINGGHGKEHDKLTEQLRSFLKVFPEGGQRIQSADSRRDDGTDAILMVPETTGDTPGYKTTSVCN